MPLDVTWAPLADLGALRVQYTEPRDSTTRITPALRCSLASNHQLGIETKYSPAGSQSARTEVLSFAFASDGIKVNNDNLYSSSFENLDALCASSPNGIIRTED
ncbi:hypothetical protein PUN28_015520 [Cardiocondyla obscurior]|uniref:Uncharacterized protein n=1 Tax=Cardiocondyla obscurior TaxID=286306 RepID=A0AAW2EWP2_9HYME